MDLKTVSMKEDSQASPAMHSPVRNLLLPKGRKNIHLVMCYIPFIQHPTRNWIPNEEGRRKLIILPVWMGFLPSIILISSSIIAPDYVLGCSLLFTFRFLYVLLVTRESGNRDVFFYFMWVCLFIIARLVGGVCLGGDFCAKGGVDEQSKAEKKKPINELNRGIMWAKLMRRQRSWRWVCSS